MPDSCYNKVLWDCFLTRVILCQMFTVGHDSVYRYWMQVCMIVQFGTVLRDVWMVFSCFCGHISCILCAKSFHSLKVNTKNCQNQITGININVKT